MARNDRKIRGIRTPLKQNTFVGRISPGEGDAEMVSFSEMVTSLGVTDEDIQDLVGAMLLDTGTIDLTYNDVNGTIAADLIADLGDLLDVDVPTPLDTEVLTWVAANNAWEAAAAAGGVSDFLSLTDTPANYTGDAGKVAQVNVGENALEFVTPLGSTQFIGDGRFAPPDPAWFATLLNHGAGTSWNTDTFGGTTLMEVTSSTNQFVSSLKAIPTGAWTATMRMKPMYQESTGASSVGIQIKDSTTGETVSLRFVAVGAESWMYVSNYTNNTFNANLTGNVDLHHEPVWIQVEDNATNFIFRYSPDGVNWVDMVTVGRTAHMTTPDLIGFFLFTDVAPTALNITYYDDDDDAATTPSIPITLEDLTDTNVPAPSDNEFLQYDIASGKWINFDLLGADNAWAGVHTNSAQPSFLAFNSANDANVTGDGTLYTVICNSEIYDQGGDYDNTTGVFTAPVTGHYKWTITVALQSTIGSAHTRAFLVLVTSNRSYYPAEFDPYVMQSSSGNVFLTASGVADMDAGDTAHFAVKVAGGTKTVAVYGNAVALGTYFAMSLME